MFDPIQSRAAARIDRVVVLSSVALLVAAAGWLSFVQDDAFISYRYAENLAEGRGLVWNEGERVEGYTNFLWALWIALGLRLGLDAIVASHALGLVCFAAALIVTWRLAYALTTSRLAAATALVLTGTHYSYICYATGGLETQLQALSFLLAAWYTLRLARAERPDEFFRPALGLGVVSAVALLNRLDSAIAVVVFGTVALVTLFRRPASSRERLTAVAALALPGLILVGGWLAWKLGYYGSILPNSFQVKVASSTSWIRGLRYLLFYPISYLLVPVLLLLPLGLRRTRRVPAAAVIGIALLALWSLYVMRVGGDFMEFRLLVPVVPLGMILLAWWLDRVVTRTWLRGLIVAWVLLGSLHHALAYGTSEWLWRLERGLGFDGRLQEEVESIRKLESHLTLPHEDWIGVGRMLAELFPDRDVAIATTAAGAIPYYSRLPAVDMIGLNDRWVAENGMIVGDRPGHQRLAPIPHLFERGVNLLIAHPWVRRQPEGERRYTLRQLGMTQLPRSARIVELPLGNGRVLTTIYLVPHPKIDRLIRDRNLSTYPVLPR